MNEPLKNGDVCLVIAVLTQGKSPNVGKIVTIDKRIFGAHGMDHSRFGPIFRCNGAGVVQLGDNGEFTVTNWADFPGIWLKKIEPPKLKDVVREVEKEV